MNWFVLTIISVFAGATAATLQKVLMRNEKSNAFSYAIVFHLILGILNLVIGLIIGTDYSISFVGLPFLLLGSVLWGICTILLFKALQLIESSEVSILNTLRIIIIAIISGLFLKETFDIQKVIGTLIVIFAVILVSNLKKGFKFNTGFYYALALAFVSAIAIITDKITLKYYDAISYNTASNFLICFLLVPTNLKIFRDLRHFIQPSFIRRILPLVIFSTLQSLSYLYALSAGNNASQVSSIRQSQVILTVLFAIVFLNERSNILRKIIAALLVTLGIFLLR